MFWGLVSLVVVVVLVTGLLFAVIRGIRNHPRDVRAFRYVALDDDRAPALPADGVGGLVGVGLMADVVDSHVAAFGGKGQ